MLKRLILALCLAGTFVPQAAAENTLTVAVQDLRPSLDPPMALANAGFPLSHNLFDTLLRRDFAANDEGTGAAILPGLAESWKRIDPTTMELTLREGLTFHNGEALTSEDVVFSFERMLDPESAYGAGRFQLSNIERVEAVNERTIRITTRTPDAVLEHLLAYPASAIVPKDYFEEVGQEAFGQRPVGAGPFKLIEFVADERVELEAFDDYWQGRPTADRVTIREVPEVSARLTALANGEADIINSIPPDQLKAIENMDCCEVRSVAVNSHVINYKTAHPVMADARFRRALNMAIDRQLIAEALWNGEATILNGHQYPEWGDIYDPDREVFAYDPQAARALIAESGYDGQPVVFVTHPVYYTNGLASAQAVIEMWRAVGVNAEVRVDENWYGNSASDETIAVRNLSDWLVVPDPHATILWSWSTTALWDDNDEYVALGEKARSELDPEARREIYGQMLDMMEEEAPGTVLYRVNEYYGVRSDLKWQPYSVYMMDFRASNLAFE